MRPATSNEADYILSLKSYQPNLYDDVKLFMDEYRMNSETKNGDIYSYTLDNSHGRFEKRERFVCNDIEMSIARIEGNEYVSEQRHYFIYSCKNLSASTLHWILDIAFWEDESRARKGFLRKISMLYVNSHIILKMDISFKESFSDKQFRYIPNFSYLDKFLLSSS